MINLFTSYFLVSNQERQAEYDECLKRNIKCVAIDKIYLLIESPTDIEILKHKKVKTILIKGRPTYNVFFELINKYSGFDDWSIVSNSDIYFDDTIMGLESYSNKYCLALTRWEVKPHCIEFLNRVDSQDCWIIKGKINNVQGNFELGKCGCDNAIAHRLTQAGYNVINPSKTIKSYHIHNSNHRTYNVNNKVPQPYRLLTPTI